MVMRKPGHANIALASTCTVRGDGDAAEAKPLAQLCLLQVLAIMILAQPSADPPLAHAKMPDRNSKLHVHGRRGCCMRLQVVVQLGIIKLARS